MYVVREWIHIRAMWNSLLQVHIECLCRFRCGFLKTKTHWYRFGLVMLYVYRYWIIYLNVSNDSLQIFGTINLDSLELVWDSILGFSLG